MANNKQIKIGVGFDVDKSGLQSILKDIESIKTKLGTISASASLGDKMNEELQEAGKTASQLSDILSKSFNTNLGTINVTKFKNELAKTGMTISDVRQKLSGAGADGKAAFAQIGSTLLSTNIQLKQSNKLLDEMAQSMSNTVQWGITSSIFNNISNSVQDAFHYVQQLDSSLNDIRIVTDKSAESMAKFAVQANNAAKNLGASTRDYTDASLIYYQQGLGEADVAARAETTLKAANVTGQNTAEVSQQLTAVWNGYKVSAEEAELYVDKLAAVAATTASDLEELSTGMSKVASAANLMGVDVDSLNAQLATIVSVTRQAPESVGTALKTIYARMGDIEAGVDTETTLGNYTAEMEAMGFNVLDANGKLRDMSDVIEEIGNKWTTLSREQQIALSQTMAGTRQYNNLLSLFDNWDMYTKAMETSANAAGTLQKQQDTYMESTAAHLQELSTVTEDVYDTLIKPEEINALLDVFVNGVDILGTFFDAFGGGVKSMAAGAAVLSGIFSKQIGKGLINLQASKSQAQNNKDLADVKKDAILKNWEDKGEPVSGSDMAKVANYEKQSQLAKDILEVENGITEQQYQQMTTLQTELGALAEEKELIWQNLIAENEKLGISEKETQELFKNNDILEERAQSTENIRVELSKEQEALAELNKEQEHNYQIQKKIQELDRLSVEDFDREADALSKTKKGKEILNLYLEEKNAQQVIQDRIEDTNNAINKQKDRVQEVNDKLKKQEQIYENITQAKEQTGEVEDQEVEKQASFNQQKEDAENAALLQNRVDLLTNSLSMLTVTWGAFQSLGSIWTNDDLTIGEKFGQTIMTIAGALPILMNSYQGLSKVLGENVTIEKILNGLIGDNTKTTITNTGATIANAIAEDKQSKEKREGAVSENIDTEGTKKNTLETIKNTAATLLEGGKKGGKKIIDSALGGLNKIWSILGKFAGPLAAIGITITAVSIATKEWQKSQEKLAEAAKTAAEEQDKVIQAEIQEYEKTKELTNAYKELQEQYKNQELSTGDLRKKVVDLLQQHGLEKEAIEAKTASYEELLSIMSKVSNFSTDNLLDELEEGKKSQKEKIKSDIWANQIKGSSRDTVNGEQTIDAGFGINWDLANTLKEYGISSDIFGHVNLDEFSNALVENGDALIAELENYDYKAAKKLIEIAQTQREAIDKAAEYTEEENKTKKDNIDNNAKNKYEEKYKDSDFQSIDEYNKSVDNLTKEYEANGIENARDEAIKFYNTVSSKGQQYSGLQAIAAGDSTKYSEVSDIVNKVAEENGKSISDVLTSEEYLKISQEDSAYMEEALNKFKEQTGNDKATYEELYNYVKNKEEESKKVNDIISSMENKGALDIADYFTEENYEELAKLEGKDREDKIDKLIDYYISEYRENFGSTYAKDLSGELTNLGNLNLYGSTEQVADSSSYDYLIDRVETLKKAFPELRHEFETLADEGKIGTEEWNESLDKTNALMKVLSLDSLAPSEINAENLEAMGLTYQEITDHIVEYGDTIENEEQIMAAAREMEAKSLGLTGEAYQEYVSELEECYKVQNKGRKVDAKTRDSLKNIAVENARTTKSLEKISSSYEEWNEVLKDGNKGTAEYATAMEEYKNAAEGVLGVELADSFLEDKENLELFNEAAKGSEEALNQLRLKAAEDIVQNLDLNDDNFEAELLNVLEMGQSELADLKVGATLDNTEFIDSLNVLLEAGELTVEEANKILSSMGIEPDIQEKEVKSSINYTMTTEMEKAGVTSATTTGETTLTIPYINPKGSIYKGSSYKPKSPKKSGGGGGNKPQTAEKDKEKFKPDIDPFHEVNEQIDLMSKKLDKLSKKQEKAFGKDLIKNLNEQNKALEKQNKNLEKKIKITTKEIANDKKKLVNFKINNEELDTAVNFNKDGSVANYDEVLKDAAKQVEQLRKKYNKEADKKYKKDSKKDKDREKLKEKLDKAKEEYSELEELLNENDQYVVDREDLRNQVRDNIDQMIENNIDIFTIPIEIKLETRDIEEDYNNFLKEWDSISSSKPIQLKVDTTKKNADLAVDNIRDLTTMVDKTQAELAIIQKGGLSNLFGDNEKLAYDTLKDYTSQLQDELSKLPQYYEEAAAAIVEAMNEVNDAMEERISDMEFYTDSLQHVINVNQKLLGENASATSNKEYYKNLAEQNNQTINELRKNAEYWKKEMDEMAGVNEEAYKTAKENYISATQEMQSALETSLENIQAALENSITSIFETFTNSLLSENWGFDNMIQDWEMAVSESETYLTNINKANQLKQLELKYQQAIDKSSSLSTQKELLALKQEELSILKEQGRLTQYDIDRANKKLQLRLAEIALEEAQNNKSKLRLRRDSQGNYSYQYVADADNVAEKQAEVDNLKAEMNEDDWKYFKTNINNAVNSFSAFKSDYAEMLASGASQEELQEFLENYGQEMANNTDLFNDSVNYLLDSTATATGQDLNKMTDEEKIAMLQEQFGEDIMTSEALSFLNKLSKETKTAEDATNYLKDNILSLAQTEIEWAEQQKKAAGEYAGYSKDFSTMSVALGDINAEVAKFNANSETTITNLKQQLDGVQGVFNTIKAFLESPSVQTGLEKLKSAIGSDGSTNDGSIKAAGSDDQAGTVGGTEGTENAKEAMEKAEENSKQGNGIVDIGDSVVITKNTKGNAPIKYHWDSKNKKMVAFKKDGKEQRFKVGTKTTVKEGPKDYDKLKYYKVKGSDYWIRQNSISGYDTGGYTGDWKSSEGRLAFLHQKELVLNAKDTENMLKMLDISRSMTSVISSVSDKINSMMAKINNVNYINNVRGANSQSALQELEQNVHIEATFPNVSQSHEIEDAFNNLINIAAQRAYKRR